MYVYVCVYLWLCVSVCPSVCVNILPNLGMLLLVGNTLTMTSRKTRRSSRMAIPEERKITG